MYISVAMTNIPDAKLIIVAKLFIMSSLCCLCNVYTINILLRCEYLRIDERSETMFLKVIVEDNRSKTEGRDLFSD